MMIILQTLYFFLPAYLANASPVIVKDLFKSLAKPVDFGMKYRGRRILGNHKTFRGIIAASLTGIIMIIIQKNLYAYDLFRKLSLMDYNSYPNLVMLGFLLGFGAIFGDSVKSF